MMFVGYYNVTTSMLTERYPWEPNSWKSLSTVLQGADSELANYSPSSLPPILWDKPKYYLYSYVKSTLRDVFVSIQG